MHSHPITVNAPQLTLVNVTVSKAGLASHKIMLASNDAWCSEEKQVYQISLPVVA